MTPIDLNQLEAQTNEAFPGIVKLLTIEGYYWQSDCVASLWAALPSLISTARRVEEVERATTHEEFRGVFARLKSVRPDEPHCRLAKDALEVLVRLSCRNSNLQVSLTKAEAERDAERRISAERWSQKQELLIQVASLQAQRDEARAQVRVAYGFDRDAVLARMDALQAQLSEAQSAREDLQRQVDCMRGALRLAEDVLARFPYSAKLWPNGMHPNAGISVIREAIAKAERQS